MDLNKLIESMELAVRILRMVTSPTDPVAIATAHAVGSAAFSILEDQELLSEALQLAEATTRPGPEKPLGPGKPGGYPSRPRFEPAAAATDEPAPVAESIEQIEEQTGPVIVQGSGRSRVRKGILEYLGKHKEGTPAQMARAIKCHKVGVQQWLAKLLASGEITMVTRGLYKAERKAYSAMKAGEAYKLAG